MFAVSEISLWAVVAGVVTAVALFIWPWSRARYRFAVGGLATVLGFTGWNLVLNATTGRNFNVDAPLIGLSWADAGSEYPDGLAYDPDDGKVFVSDEHGGTDTVISTATNQRTGSIKVGGDVGNTQYDAVSRRIYVAVGARNQLVAIDPTQDRVVGQYDLPGCDDAHGLAIDEAARLAFVACDENATLLAFDLTTMTVTATRTAGSDPDVLAFDTGLHR